MVFVKAIFDYSGSEEHKIRFVKGDTFELVDDKDPNWWHVILPRVGSQIPEHIYVPATYVQKIEEDIIDDFIDVSLIAFSKFTFLCMIYKFPTITATEYTL